MTTDLGARFPQAGALSAAFEARGYLAGNQLAAEFDQAASGVEVIHTLTRSQPLGWSGYARRVDAALLARVAWPAAAMPLAYVCGPTSFVEAASQALVQSGYPPERVKTERFGATGGT